MTDNQETSADIIAEMRRRIAVKMSDAWYTQEEWRKLCDRLEAAIRREHGDCAKMREALERVLCWLKRMNAQPLNTLAVSELTPSYAVHRTAKSIIEDNDYHISQLTAALAAPPRNCDLPLVVDGPADNNADKAWLVFKHRNPDAYFDVPGLLRCIDWLLAHVTEKEGDK